MTKKLRGKFYICPTERKIMSEEKQGSVSRKHRNGRKNRTENYGERDFKDYLMNLHKEEDKLVKILRYYRTLLKRCRANPSKYPESYEIYLTTTIRELEKKLNDLRAENAKKNDEGETNKIKKSTSSSIFQRRDIICEYLLSPQGMKNMATILYKLMQGEDFKYSEEDVYNFIVENRGALQRAITKGFLGTRFFRLLVSAAYELKIPEGEIMIREINKLQGREDEPIML